MKLAHLIDNYIALKRSLGMRFRADAGILRAFGHAMGDIPISQVDPCAVQAFIAGNGPVTAFWHQKYKILANFFRFMLARDLTTTFPLPATIPKCPPSQSPYIYSLEELRRILTATERLQNPMSPLQAFTLHTLILLLYSTGMRVGEALALTLIDVDLNDRLIVIRDAKFHKTRWVPTGPKLTRQLSAYASQRCKLTLPEGENSPFFATRTGQGLSYDRACRLFRRLRRFAEVRREERARYQPRLHDLRHTAAVHRVIAWYRQGANVQRLLPQLATYLGHVDIASTQRYLSMTPELLHVASLRFEHYVQSEVCHE